MNPDFFIFRIPVRSSCFIIHADISWKSGCFIGLPWFSHHFSCFNPPKGPKSQRFPPRKATSSATRPSCLAQLMAQLAIFCGSSSLRITWIPQKTPDSMGFMVDYVANIYIHTVYIYISILASYAEFMLIYHGLTIIMAIYIYIHI